MKVKILAILIVLMILFCATVECAQKTKKDTEKKSKETDKKKKEKKVK